MKPWLLVDVDDVLNVCRSGRHDPWYCHCHPAWVRLRMDPYRDGKGYKMTLNQSHGPALLALADAAELAWCTSWEDYANTHVGRFLQLPTLPVVPYPPRPQELRRTMTLGAWKAQHAVAFARVRPFVALENEPDFAGECARRAGGTPHHVVTVNPKTGLTDTDLAEAAAAVASLARV